MPKVRVTMFPHLETEVPEDEIPVLRAQGLLIEDTAAPAQPAAAEPAAKPAPSRKDTSQ